MYVSIYIYMQVYIHAHMYITVSIHGHVFYLQELPKAICLLHLGGELPRRRLPAAAWAQAAATLGPCWGLVGWVPSLSCISTYMYISHTYTYTCTYRLMHVSTHMYLEVFANGQIDRSMDRSP